ncbi:MAG: M15 family metallopeptidase [Candidatus Saccharimonadales bacterium]
MTEQFTTKEPQRYEDITVKNAESLYMTDVHRPFDVYMSFASIGDERTMYNKFNDDPEIVEAGKAANRLVRFVIGGNTSTAVNKETGEALYGPKEFSSDEKLADARANMRKFENSVEIDQAKVLILNPDRDYTTPLQVVNVDKDPARYQGAEAAKLDGMGDMIFTYDPNVVLGVRPADCPLVIVSAETPKGRIYIMTHFAWQGAATNQIKDMEHEFDILGVDLSTATVYVTPGGQAESFPFENAPYDPDEKYPYAEGLFQDVAAHSDSGETKYNFKIDTPHFVYQQLLSIGFTEEQIFLDTTDTTSPSAGTSSHSRSSRLDDDNGRDYVLVKLNKVESPIGSNPNKPTPPEIEWQITPLEVEYIDFNGEKQQGTIEVNRDVYDDVKEFFASALELGFPIEKVVRSSDSDYAWDDDKLMAANTSSSFNYRLIKGTDTPSLHGLGLAFDVNTRLNPYVRYNDDGTESIDPQGAAYEPDELGVLTADHPLVLFMKVRGWEWGGDWTKESGRTDYQHFQKSLKAE